jgi:hypothetical protein
MDKQRKTDPSVELLSKLYEQDYYAWTEQQAALLRAGRFTELDLAHLIEEVEDMGRSQRQAVKSALVKERFGRGVDPPPQVSLPMEAENTELASNFARASASVTGRIC